MIKNKSSLRVLAWQSLSVLLLAAPLIAIGLLAWQKHQADAARVAELEPRYARLQGLIAVKPQLDAAAVSAVAFVSRHAYPATLDATQAGNASQQLIRAVFADSQMSVESIQVVEPKDLKGFQLIGVVLRADGTLASLQDALLKLRTQSPSIFVDSVSIQSTGAVRPASTQRISVNLSAAVLRAKP